MKKRALSWLLALTMLLTLAPQALPTWASAEESKTETKLSANTYSALGLSRDVNTSVLPKGQQPYGKAEPGNTVATNVINELYVNFNGSIHYGWSILDNIPMEYRDDCEGNWTNSRNFYGAMDYWRPNQQPVHYGNGNKKEGALFAENGSKTGGVHDDHLGKSINSANKHLTYQYSKSEAFSPNTGKDNYVAEMTIDSASRVNLYIYQVEGGNKRYVRSKFVCNASASGGDANDKTNIIYNWEYDAMYDIAAGDMDGDGYDEIAVYAQNYVYVYSFEDGTLSELIKKETVKPEGVNEGGGKYKKLKTAVVTLAFGDLNADDKDELVIAENIGYGSSKIADGKVGIYSLTSAKKLHEEKIISLKYDDSMMVRYANVATGDIDKDYKDELIIAGYISADVLGQTIVGKDNIAYRVVDGTDTGYTVGDWKTTSFVKKELLGRVVDNANQLIPPVALTCAATQGVGHAEQIFLAGCLYSYNTDGSLTKLTEISTNREYKKDNGNKANKEEIFVVNVVAGNFNGNRNGQEQIVYAFGMKHDGSDRYWYDIGYINKKAPGPENANQSSSYWYGQEQVMNYESSYNRDDNKARASLYLSLAAVDCDNDSTLMRYKGQTVTWTKPEVLTVLQSAPYFQDLQDTRDYINQGQTGYGKGSSSSSSAIAGTSLKVGTYVSFEQDFSVFGVKVASIEAEAQSTHEFEYEFQSTKEKSIEVRYSGSAGDDYAVVYAVPYMEYQYETWVPGYTLQGGNYVKYLNTYLSQKLGKAESAITEKEREKAAKELGVTQNTTVEGSWQPSSVMVPMKPATVLITVDDYDAIAEQTEGLEPIRGNILNSTPGEPATYDKINSRGTFNKIGDQQRVTTAEGGNVSLEATTVDTTAHTFAYNYEFEAKAGAGAGGVTVGVLAGLGTTAGGGISSSQSNSYSATVDNLPKDASQYGFSWQFGWRNAKLNNNDVLVLEYRLDDVAQLPSMPKNLRVDSVTAESVTLKWDKVVGSGAYDIYQVSTTDPETKYFRARVPGTADSYTDTNVNPNNSYTYCVQNISQAGTKSIYSTTVKAITLTDANGSFVIKQQPGNKDNSIQTYVGGTATATIEAEYLKNGEPKSLSYIWQQYDTATKKWVSCSSGYGERLELSNVTEDMDGTKYRCQVLYDANLYIYTDPVTLTIGKANSATTLESNKTNQTVNASYVKTETVTTGKTTGPLKETINDVTYLVYTKGNDITVYMKDGTYYSKNANNTVTELEQTPENVQLTYVVKTTTSATGDQPATETVEEKNILFSKMEKDETFNASEANVTYVYQAEPKNTSGDGEGSTDSESTAETYTATEKYIVTDNNDVVVYHCQKDAEGETPAIDFWFVQSGDNKYAADVQTATKLVINNTTKVDVNDLVQVEDEVPVVKTEETYKEGEKVTLTATPSDPSQPGLKLTGKVVFKIVNSIGDGSKTVDATIGDTGKATAEWIPTAAGVYTITAAYEGNEKYMGSVSGQTITINVVVPEQKTLMIDSPNSMTYGDAAIELKTTLLKGAKNSESASVETNLNGVTYAVKNADGTAVPITGSTFAPTAAGTYTVTATYTIGSETLTATKSIVVNKRTVTIVPSVNQETKVKSFTLNGIANNVDKALFTLKEGEVSGNVDISCAGINTTAAGEYRITVTYTATPEIDKNYIVVCDNTQVYEIKDNVVKVTNATNNSNGSVELKYSLKDSNDLVSVYGTSMDILKGSKLIAVASPKAGYKLAKWTINDQPVYLNQVDGTYNTSLTYTVSESLDMAYRVEAEFKPVYYTLSFSVQNNDGSITANYWNGTTTEGTFQNGGNLSPLQSVQLTANMSGKAIKGWKITRGTTEEIVQVNGKNYTGASYILSNISADTTVTVLTDEATSCPVTISLVDADGNPLVNEDATVSFGDTILRSEDGTYTYERARKHDNLTVTLTLPAGLIVEEWKDSTGKVLADGTLSNGKKTWTISNLSQGYTWTVKCSTANYFQITTETKLNGDTSESAGATAGTISVYRAGQDETTGKINSGDTVLQATSLRVVVKPETGYQLLSVTCNKEDRGTTSDFTINGVNKDINIVATFVKKPVVRFSVATTEGEAAHGSLTANNLPISDSPITVSYGDKNPITFTATPDTGYEVDKWTVNGIEVNGEEVANSDNQTYTYTPNAETGITSDLTVTVSFKAIPSVTVNFSVFDKILDAEGGTDGTLTASVTRKGMDGYKVEDFNTGSLTVYRDSVVRFTATPDSGYKVGVWQLNGDKWENQPELSITSKITSPQNVQVQFDLIGDKVTYGFRSDGASDKAQISAKYTPNGSTEEQNFTTGATPEENGKITFTVSELDTGYEIEGWYVDGMKQDGETGATFTHAVTKGVGVEVQAKIIRKSYQVKFSAINGTVGATVDGGSITSGTSVDGDKQVTFTATPVSNTGYTFAGWTVNGDEQDNTSTTLTLTITQATTVSAKFTLNTVSYAVNYGVVGTETDRHGTLTAKVGSQTFTSGEPKPADSTVVFTAQPESGYRVKGWYSNEGGTTAIDGTKVEQETYTIDSLTAEANVYVAFEKIPTYEITVTTTGLGHVTAKVNHVDAEITGGKLTVNHHDNVVFTAVPDTKQNLTNWTLDGDNKGNSSMTLTLDDVTNTHDVTANFATSQRITFRTIYDDSKGTLTAQAGYNTSLETINASSTTGIQVDNGKKIVLTAKPNSGYMVEKWIVNTTEVTRTNMEDLGVTMEHYLSNELTIDNLSKSTTVEVKFKQYNGYTIPGSGTGYTVTVVKYNPATTYEGENSGKIRENGDVTFTVSPATDYTGITKLMINDYDCIEKSGSVGGCAAVTVDKIENGKVTVTVKGVTQNISLTAEALKLQTENKDLSEVPTGLNTKYTSLTALENDLRASVKTRNSKVANIRLLDIELQYYDGSEWKKVTDKTKFPAGGITVEVPYSKLGDSDKNDSFTVIHMLTADMNGKKAGDVEEITPITKGENGISFHVTSLSPFAIGWTKYVAPTPGGGGGGGGGAVSTCTLTFDTNGGSAIDKITKDSGTTIDLAAYKPTRTGYTFAGWFSDKALTKAVTSVKLTANTTVYAKWTESGGTAQNPFVDVKEGAYYYDAVLWAVEQKITSGTSATTFSPDASCTRAQMVTFLWRAAGSPKVENGKNPFTDVKADAYYYDAVLWAVEKGVTSGTSATTFSPDATVTRGQTVTFLYRNAGSPEVSGTMPFTDVEADAYYAKAVQWAVQQKITTGTSETTFSPMSDCTRGQIVTFLYRAK